MFIDDIEVSTGEGSTSFEDDGDPMDGWTVSGAPQDDAGHRGPEPQRLGPRAAASGSRRARPWRHRDTLYLGFGFEGISGVATRNEVMERTLDHLLP